MKTYKFTISGHTYEVDILEIEGDLVRLEVNGTSYLVEIHKQIKQAKTPTLIRPILKEPQKIIEKKEGGPRTSVKSPLPGVIVSIAVKEGDRVTKGQLLLVMEAMKMENEIKSPSDGEVISIKVAHGQAVLQEENLIEIN